MTIPFAFLLLCSAASTAMGGGIVAVDQAGYTRSAPKSAVLTTNADSFRVIDAATRATVYHGATAYASLGDAATGMELWEADFGALQQAGRYLIVTSAGDTSQHFLIADTVYAPVYRASLKGFYYQRCGTALYAAHAGAYTHPECHATDGFFHSTAESTGFRISRGGWHDAGDYGKYVVNAGITTGTLLMAYEWFPARFAGDDLQIPESRNGVPDILDEARYELQWLLTMQKSDGGVFTKLTKPQFESFVMPDKDTGLRYIYQISSTATGDFVAMMARAARVFQPYDSAFARTCREAAVRGWQYLTAHPSIVPTGGFRNPAGTATGEYGDGNDTDERLWAAAELYLTTGDEAVHSYFTGRYSTGGIITGTMGWPGVRTLAQLTYLRGSRAGIDSGVQTAIRQSLLSYSQSLLKLRDESGFRSAMGLGNYVWGSNSQLLNNAVLMIMARHEGASQVYEDAALDQLHHVLGTNAHDLSFVTGIGARHIMRPHHRPSGADGIVEPVPGLLAGGPNRNIMNDPVLQARFTASTPPALCYVDDQGSYASNEIAINWNAPLVFVAGYFGGGSPASPVRPDARALPQGFRLEQNYPNPFNPSTTIRFQLPAAGQVRLTVFDTVGRLVAVLVDGESRAGDQQVRWDAAGFASGAYIARLEARSSGSTMQASRAMMLVK